MIVVAFGVWIPEMWLVGFVALPVMPLDDPVVVVAVLRHQGRVVDPLEGVRGCRVEVISRLTGGANLMPDFRWKV